MADDELTIDDEISPEEEMDRTLDTIRRMREEEAALTTSRMPTTPAPSEPPPPQTFEQTMAFQPTLSPDLSRAPGVASPAAVMPPSRTVYTGQPREVPMTAAVPGPLDMRSLLLMQQYEANEGYRRDIAQGMPQASAMAKWGPTMFSSRTGTGIQPRYMNVGGRLYQVGLGGVSAPLTPEVRKPQYRNVGGQLFEVGTEGGPKPITPEPVSRIALQDRQAIVKRMGNIQTMLDADPNLPNANELRRELSNLQRQRDAIVTSTRTAVAAPTSTAAAPAAASAAGRKRRGGPKEKLARAQELELQYPDASKAEIMEMLKMEFD